MTPHTTISYTSVRIVAVLVVCGASILGVGLRRLAVGEEPARASDTKVRAVRAREASLPSKSVSIIAAPKSEKQDDKQADKPGDTSSTMGD